MLKQRKFAATTTTTTTTIAPHVRLHPPTFEEISARIPPEGILLPALIKIFKPRISDRDAFIGMVKKANVRYNKESKMLFPKDVKDVKGVNDGGGGGGGGGGGLNGGGGGGSSSGGNGMRSPAGSSGGRAGAGG